MSEYALRHLVMTTSSLCGIALLGLLLNGYVAMHQAPPPLPAQVSPGTPITSDLNEYGVSMRNPENLIVTRCARALGLTAGQTITVMDDALMTACLHKLARASHP